MPRIGHYSVREPVSIRRWLQYYIACWMMRVGPKWHDQAVFPFRCPECGWKCSSLKDVAECDHIPF